MPNSEVLKVMVVAGGGEERPVRDMFILEGFLLTDDIDEADLVTFVGGEDVDPAMYNCFPHHSTRYNTVRDISEQQVYAAALERGIPMAGICRGGQFLNVMNEGKMYQDVDGHNLGSHTVFTVGQADPIRVTSTHHQMMIPNYHVHFLPLLMAHQSKRKAAMSSLGEDRYPIFVPVVSVTPTDVEAIYYPDTRCLCFQPHPEYIGEAENTRQLFFQFLEEYVFSEQENDWGTELALDGIPF